MILHHTLMVRYGDLDNDGDLDLILNNINDRATLLENTLSNENGLHNYIRFDLKGDTYNQLLMEVN